MFLKGQFYYEKKNKVTLGTTTKQWNMDTHPGSQLISINVRLGNRNVCLCDIKDEQLDNISKL